MNIYQQRIEIAIKAVKIVRTKSEYALKLCYSPTSLVVSSPEKWAIGVIGILDFVATGDVDKILLREVREEVKKLLKNKEGQTQ